LLQLRFEIFRTWPETCIWRLDVQNSDGARGCD
jgi:hypothetical protein